MSANHAWWKTDRRPAAAGHMTPYLPGDEEREQGVVERLVRDDARDRWPWAWKSAYFTGEPATAAVSEWSVFFRPSLLR